MILQLKICIITNSRTTSPLTIYLFMQFIDQLTFRKTSRFYSDSCNTYEYYVVGFCVMYSWKRFLRFWINVKIEETVVDIGINRHRLDCNNKKTPTSLSKDWDAQTLVREENRDWASFPHNNCGQNFSSSAYHVSPPCMLWSFKG